MNDHFAELLAQRRIKPREDLVTALMEAYEDGERLTEGELIRTCGAMLVAGHETTTNLISNAVWLLLQRPSQLERLRDDDALYSTAIEEVLRYESPFQALPRTLTRDVELHGQTMRKGQIAYAMIGAANRDPDRFPRPNEFDIVRPDNKHLAFGHGIHFCVRAPPRAARGADCRAGLAQPISRLAARYRSASRLEGEHGSTRHGTIRPAATLSAHIAVVQNPG